MKRLQGRVAVITGAGSGIGRALSLEFAKKGAHVAVVDFDADRAERVREEVAAAGVDATAHKVDVRDADALVELAAQVKRSHGHVNVLVNNAGVTHVGAFADTSLKEFNRVIDTNLHGTIAGCHAFLPSLLEVDEGHIVNLSSVFGLIGVERQTAYCASKFAVRGFSLALTEELRDTTVNVTCVHPAGVDTNIMNAASMAENESPRRGEMSKKFQEAATPAADVARDIVRAVEKNKERILVAKLAPVFDWAQRAAPGWGNKAINGLMRRGLGSPDQDAG